ncbi:MAG: amino acid-binding protein [Chloroflexi bacterium]|nr:MAG: amino acid-binding protein [Chloroflexota bacterium]
MAHHFKDLTIELDEKVGSVAAAAEALGKAGVNIEGICGFVVGGKGVGHVLVADPGKARQALQTAGARVTGEQDVLILDIEDKPGSLGKLTRKIADAGVNLNTVYLATKTRVVIGAGEIEKARTAAGEGAASVR